MYVLVIVEVTEMDTWKNMFDWVETLLQLCLKIDQPSLSGNQQTISNFVVSVK